MRSNPAELYLPLRAKVVDVIDMTSDVKLFSISPENKFRYKPGQFLMVSTWGAGEVPISITSTQGVQENIELCIRSVGVVTSAIHSLRSGDGIGIRGPFGNGFAADRTKGRDVLFIAGGIGIAPLRSLINEILKNKKGYKNIKLIYGSRTPSDILFADDIREWQRKGMDVIFTVDRKDKKWKGNTGVVTEHLGKWKVSSRNTHAFVCGPHVMIEAVMKDLSSRGMPDNNILTTLEAHMKCGVGKCGHCYADGKYICTDGPVFSYEEIKKYDLNGP